MTSHGAAILLAGAPFTDGCTMLFGSTPRPNVGPFHRSTGSGISGSCRSASTAEARYQLIQAVDLHERPVGDGGPRQFRLGNSQIDLSRAERVEAGSRAALLAVEAVVSISETFPIAGSEAISRVNVIDDGLLNWNSRRCQLLRSEIVVLDALVREAQTAPGAAIGRRETVFPHSGTFSRWSSGSSCGRYRALVAFADAVAQIDGSSNRAGVCRRWLWLCWLLWNAGRPRCRRLCWDALVREA